jgi:hypothetical protein
LPPLTVALVVVGHPEAAYYSDKCVQVQLPELSSSLLFT